MQRPGVGTAGGWCGRRGWGPLSWASQGSGLDSLVMGKHCREAPRPPGPEGLLVWVLPCAPSLCRSQDCILAVRSWRSGAPRGSGGAQARVGEGGHLTFLRLGQRPLQLPLAALGPGELVLHLTQPAAQACHLEAPVVLAEGPKLAQGKWRAEASS